MRKFITILTLALTLGAGSALAQQNKGQELTQAMMQAYNQLIRENPNDYDAYFRRASEYYRTNQYLRALQDINKALELTPSSEQDLRFAEYVLRANIYENTKEPEKALADFTSAIALDPTNYVSVYQKANVEYELGKYPEAKVSYRKLQAMNPRSLEGLFGLARIAVKEQNYGMANELADKAVAINPSQADAYIRRASIRSSLGNNAGAVDDLIMAMSTDQADNRAIRELVNMGRKDYPATITGLSKAVTQAPRTGMFRYMRAMIEQAHYRYNDAWADFKVLVDENIYDYPGIYASMAECSYALGHYAQASADIEYAIGTNPQVADYQVQLAKIRRAQWRPEEALAAAEKALAIAPDNNEALLQKSLALVDMKRYNEASDAIGEAILNDSENSTYLLTRGWILSEYLKQGGNAKIYYQRVLDLPADDVVNLTGFARLFNGDAKGGEEWMESILRDNTDTDGRLNYIAACYYAQAGDHAKAIDHMDKSLKLGYANYHDWTQATDARVSVAPIRDEYQFNELLKKYKSLF